MPYITSELSKKPYCYGSSCGSCAYKHISLKTFNMKVQGKGSVKVLPDAAVISLGAITENKNLKIAQEENAIIAERVINTLRNMGIEEKDISTETYNIEPQYDYVEGKQVFRGYRVINNLRVTIRALDKAGQIIDAAVTQGANIVNNIRFIVENPILYYRKALTVAINDALAKSRDIGKTLGVTVSEIPTSISEANYEYTALEERTQFKAYAAATPIKPGQIEITAQVEAIFAYR